MSRRVVLTLMLTLAVIGAAPACSGGGSGPPSRKEAVGLAGKVATAGYKTVDERLGALETALRSCDRDAASDAWSKARIAWAEARVFPLGPAMNRRVTPAVDFWPHNRDFVMVRLRGSEPVDVDAVAALGAPYRGLPGIETALGFEPWGERPCTYARSAATAARRVVGAVASDWEQLESKFGKGPTDLADLVSGLAEATATVHGNALTVPSGLRSGGPPDPSMVHGALALEEARATLATIEKVIQQSVLPLLPEGPRTNLQGALTTARRGLDAVPAPLTTAVVNATDVVKQAAEPVKVVEVLLITEVASQLGLTLSFSSTDGD